MNNTNRFFLHLLAIVAAGAPALAEVPPPCLAVGYKLKTLDSDFARGSQAFDEDGSYQPGFQWYRWNWFNVRPNKQLSHRDSDGSISAQGDFGGHVVSAAMSSKAPGFVGTAFGGGACIEVKLKFDPRPRGSNEAHPSFWAMSKEHLDSSGADRWPGKDSAFTHFAEWDILEYYKVSPPGFLSSWIDWYGPYIPHGEFRVGEQVCSRPFCKRARSFTPDSAAFSESIDWNEWQTVTGVWVPASADHPGCIQTFLNGRPIAPAYCWKSPLAQRERIEEFLDFSVIDRHHMVLVISSGNSPIFVRSVRVYQQSERDNLSN